MLNQILEDYEVYGCLNNCNYEAVHDRINKDIEDVTSEINKIFKTDESLIAEDIKVTRRLGRHLKRLEHRKNLYDTHKILKLSVSTDNARREYISYIDLNTKERNLLLKSCIEKKDKIFTVTFNEFKTHLVYKDTELEKFFGKSVITSISDYLRASKVIVPDKDIRTYLAIYAKFNDNIKSSVSYMKRKDTLDSIHKVLAPLVKGAKLIEDYNYFSVKQTEILKDIIRVADINKVSLYYYNNDTFSLRLDSDVSIKDLKLMVSDSLEKLGLSYISYSCSIGHSLLDTINEIKYNDIYY